jgi:hypothetical protein
MSEIEAKVWEVSRQAGMLAFSYEGERARMFCMETAVSHPFVLFTDSWADNMEQMVESNASRVFWTISDGPAMGTSDCEASSKGTFF